MKKTIFAIAMSVALISSCRLADFTVISTKNVDNKEESVQLKTNVKAKAFDLKTAIDKCIEQEQGGTYLTNVVISQGVFMYRVKADVWGTKQ